jgi:peptidoglycan/xylan/chitin deacetylase (PgdA/CDA1 family)
MNAMALVRVTVNDERLGGRVPWADGMEMTLPASIVDGPDPPPAAMAGLAEAHRLRAAFTEGAPWTSRSPLPYTVIPGRMRSLIASALGRLKRHAIDRWASFPRFPLDLSADFLADLAGLPPSPYAGGPVPIVLTHDLDSREGLRNLVRSFLDIEEAAGARSSNYVVPAAWPIDHGLLAEVRARGHELGIHGYDHSSRTAFLDAEARRSRLERARPLIERYEMIGYRSPSLWRTRALLGDLARYYRYDSSIPTSGGPFPAPNNGCASARPFEVEGIAELPISLPRDGSLRMLGYEPERILTTWQECARRIADSGGVVCLLTHCEDRFSGNARMREIYRRFLDWAGSSGRFIWSTPRAAIDRYLRRS